VGCALVQAVVGVLEARIHRVLELPGPEESGIGLPLQLLEHQVLPLVLAALNHPEAPTTAPSLPGAADSLAPAAPQAASGARAVDAALGVLVQMAQQGPGAAMLVRKGIFVRLSHCAVLRKVALGGGSPYCTVGSGAGSQVIRDPAHTAWCEALVLVAHVLRQTSEYPEAMVASDLFVDQFRPRWIFAFTRGVQQGMMAYLEEAALILQLLVLRKLRGKDGDLLVDILQSLAMLVSATFGNDDAPNDLCRPASALEKRAGQVEAEEDTRVAAAVPSVFHQRVQVLVLRIAQSSMMLCARAPAVSSSREIILDVSLELVAKMQKVAEHFSEARATRSLLRVQPERGDAVVPLALAAIPLRPRGAEDPATPTPARSSGEPPSPMVNMLTPDSQTGRVSRPVVYVNMAYTPFLSPDGGHHFDFLPEYMAIHTEIRGADSLLTLVARVLETSLWVQIRAADAGRAGPTPNTAVARASDPSFAGLRSALRALRLSPALPGGPGLRPKLPDKTQAFVEMLERWITPRFSDDEAAALQDGSDDYTMRQGIPERRAAPKPRWQEAGVLGPRRPLALPSRTHARGDRLGRWGAPPLGVYLP